MEEKKESKLGLGIIIGLLVAAVVGLGVFVLFDKVIFDKEDDNKTNEVKPTPSSSPVVPTPSATPTTNAFDGTKEINGQNGWTYDISDENYASNIGLTATLNSDKKGATIKIDWSKYFETYGLSVTDNAINDYNVTNFESEIKDVLLAGFGQASGYETAFYLMNDGTVEYTPIKNALGSNGSSKDTVLRSYGKLSGISGVVKLAIAVDKCNLENCIGGGSYNIIGIKQDGTFYNLSKILMTTNYYEF